MGYIGKYDEDHAGHPCHGCVNRDKHGIYSVRCYGCQRYYGERHEPNTRDLYEKRELLGNV